jgi:hypothetical protein
MNELHFLNSYWHKCNNHQGIAANKHFLVLDKTLMDAIKSPGIREDVIETKYKGTKKWDMHFPEKKIAIEYKTVSDVGGSNHYMGSCINHRIEEAIGAAIDLKYKHTDYKLGYIWIFVFRNRDAIVVNQVNKAIRSFEKMLEDNLYDFFFPAITFGPDDHQELSGVHTFSKFVSDIKNQPIIQTTPLTEAML